VQITRPAASEAAAPADPLALPVFGAENPQFGNLDGYVFNVLEAQDPLAPPLVLGKGTYWYFNFFWYLVCTVPLFTAQDLWFLDIKNLG
jgi:hypothetical protein